MVLFLHRTLAASSLALPPVALARIRRDDEDDKIIKKYEVSDDPHSEREFDFIIFYILNFVVLYATLGFFLLRYYINNSSHVNIIEIDMYVQDCNTHNIRKVSTLYLVYSSRL